jgi:hypothetical protein
VVQNPAYKLLTLTRKITYLLLAALLFFSVDAFSQGGVIRNAGGRLRQLGGNFSNKGGGGNDSLKRRNKHEDSLTARFRYLDSTRNYSLDSSVNDFTRRFPIPATYYTLGNTGNAARDIVFSPALNPGWDAGFHAFDIYRYRLEKVRFFNTTRPYSELNYVLAGRGEQMIEVVHTQNIKPNWNFLFQYRLINSPGFFKNQKTNHNNYLFTTWYESVNKRYNSYLVFLANKLQSGESGGLRDTANFIDDVVFKDRFGIPTKIGGDPEYGKDFFSTETGTGNRYKDFTVLLRQQYDFGKKDSIVTDSTVFPLFYPRLRFEYTFQYSKYSYQFSDLIGDSVYYKNTYGQQFASPIDTLVLQDKWVEMKNDFSIYTYPDAKNLHQFLKLGAAVQNLSLTNIKGKANPYNIFGHAEYRNRTRNQKWNIEANGKLYFTGLNSGDYEAFASLQRSVGKKTGYVQLGFENVNRTPSFIFDRRSNFNLDASAIDFKKENTTHLSASLYQPWLQLRLQGHYYLLTNYTYITDFYKLQQESTLFNLLQIGAEKTISIGRKWKWHADVYFQQVIGNGPVNVPTVFTRNRIGYEGSLGFKNLSTAFGLEIKYHTPYKADGYSPVLGQFYYQNDSTIRNQVPNITGYVHFRIMSFKFYLRAENLNTGRVLDNKFGFTNNLSEVPGYYYPGLILRFGIFWSFVN